jgi:ADP-heptose:LPS heptosyltransferase
LPDKDKQFIENGAAITYLGDQLNSFSDAAAIVKNMDLVICVDTSLAHVAGAIRKKVFVLLSHTSDWMWFWIPIKALGTHRQLYLGKQPQVIGLEWFRVLKNLRYY